MGKIKNSGTKTVLFCFPPSVDGGQARLSSIAPSAILGSLLDDQQWHSVLLERVGKQTNFTVDTNTEHFQIKAETDALDIDYEVSQHSQNYFFLELDRGL